MTVGSPLPTSWSSHALKDGVATNDKFRGERNVQSDHLQMVACVAMDEHPIFIRGNRGLLSSSSVPSHVMEDNSISK